MNSQKETNLQGVNKTTMDYQNINTGKEPFVRRPFPKIDVHCHLTTDSMYGFTAEKRLEFNKLFGVDKCIIMSGNKVPDSNFLPPELARAMNSVVTSELAAEISTCHPDNFYWFCNLVSDGTSNTYHQLKTYKEMGAIGVGEFGQADYVDSTKLDYLYSCCEELEMPLLFHMTYNGNGYGIIDEPGLPHLENALKKHPNMIFIGHSQPFWREISTDALSPDADYPSGKVKPGRLLELFETYPNLYADLSADSGGNAILRDADYGIQFLNQYQDRLFYGSDIGSSDFVYPLSFYLDSLLHQKKISGEAYYKICRGNAEKILLMMP